MATYVEPQRGALARRAEALARKTRARVGEMHGRLRGLLRAADADPETAAARTRALGALDRLSRGTGQEGRAPAFSNVLVDGMWENPNYWTRYAMFRAALGLDGARETGLLGPYNRAAANSAFDAFGIDAREDFVRARRAAGNRKAQARRLLRGVRSADDLLRLELPYGFLPEIVYDGLLKRQRRGDVDVGDPLLVDDLAEALNCLEAAHALFAAGDYDLVALSHALNFDFGALAWCALAAGATVVVLYGDFGTTRFIRIRSAEDLLNYINCPDRAEIEALPANERDRRAEAGAAYLDTRFRGVSGDLSAAYVYRGRQEVATRADIAATYGWDPETPIVCVYASNWFDFPHSCAMENFRDFRDWIDATLAVAAETTDINWIFKPHPCDDWYGAVRGPTVAALVEAVDRPHVRLVDTSWNGLALMQAIDGAVTYYGTIGIEMGAIGKPTLVADRGWYTEHGFAVYPGGRDDYLAALRGRWWEGFDADGATRMAREFIGWYFCDAAWHGDYHFRDDSEQATIYIDLPGFLDIHAAAMAHEIDTIRNWMADGHRYYHTYKMRHCEVALTASERHIGYVRDPALANALQKRDE